MHQRFSAFRFVVYLVGFTGLLLLRLLTSPNGEGGMLAWFGCVALLAAGYLVYYAASQGHLRNLASGIVVYLAIAAVAAACPPFILLLMFWSVAGLFTKRRAMLLHAFASLALYALVFPMPVARLVGMPELAGAPAGIGYVVFALAYSAMAARSPLRIGVFKFATMLLAVPLIASFIALVGGGMLSRPERRTRNTMRARRASASVITLPALPGPTLASEAVAAGRAIAMPIAVVAGAAAEVLLPVAVAK
jgi:hypothetical protein